MTPKGGEKQTDGQRSLQPRKDTGVSPSFFLLCGSQIVAKETTGLHTPRGTANKKPQQIPAACNQRTKKKKRRRRRSLANRKLLDNDCRQTPQKITGAGLRQQQKSKGGPRLAVHPAYTGVL